MRASVDLYWLPLGAGGHFVRFNGRLYEAAAALRARRRPSPLYHSALEVRVDEGRYVIEMAPVWNESTPERGVVAKGAVGSHLAGRLRLFRYEVRCWRNGRIPDVAEAVDSPRRLALDAEHAGRVLDRVREAPHAGLGTRRTRHRRHEELRKRQPRPASWPTVRRARRAGFESRGLCELRCQ